jgi:hypothetical protein
VEILRGCPAADIDFADEKPGADEGREVEKVARGAGAEIPLEIAESLGEKRAKNSRGYDGDSAFYAPHHEHRYQVKKSERDLADYAPIDERNSGDENRRSQKYGSPAALKQKRVHAHDSLIEEVPHAHRNKERLLQF